MDKIKSFAPLLSVVLVGACIVASLSGYEAPVYASELQLTEEHNTVEQEDEKEEAAEGSFDLEDGVYRGTGTGYAGSITVAVEIKDKTIVSIEVLSVEADDAAFVNRAKGVIDKIIEAQSLDVDVVSGATYSSNGIISAVKNALTGETDSGETAASENTAAAGSSTTVDTVEDAAAYKDGTYYGSGTGFRGSLTVKVVISGGKITSIEITESSDDSSYLNKAASLINNIISSQSTNVDTVSGATYSSVGIIQAVRNALSKAAVSTTADTTQSTDDSDTQSSTSSSISGTVPYVEGIYYGTAEGYAGDITVAVVIQDYTIKAILVTESEDDEEFFSRAMDVVKNVIKNQNTDVDLVSGATYSSTGLLEAIKNALKEAEKATNGSSDKTDDTDKENNNQDGDDDSKDDDSNGDDDNKDSENDENKDTIYNEGIYSISVVCLPDEDEDFEAYNLTLDVTIRDDKIVAITNIAGDGDSSNDSYIRRAANGTSSVTGVVAQIIESGTPENIDTVSRATCTSNSIIEACVKALENAKK
ncbi:MAG: FMN-binding protein [Lachnospiraceae bacterium]